MNCGDDPYDLVIATFDVTLRLMEHQNLLNFKKRSRDCDNACCPFSTKLNLVAVMHDALSSSCLRLCQNHRAVKLN
jgi:hypothetical protein